MQARSEETNILFFFIKIHPKQRVCAGLILQVRRVEGVERERGGKGFRLE
jgi:hypothetical protein